MATPEPVKKGSFDWGNVDCVPTLDTLSNLKDCQCIKVGFFKENPDAASRKEGMVRCWSSGIWQEHPPDTPRRKDQPHLNHMKSRMAGPFSTHY